MKYLTPNWGYWIVVHGNGEQKWFRAYTNDIDFYDSHISKLEFQPTELEAQNDLDSLAKELSLKPAPPIKNNR